MIILTGGKQSGKSTLAARLAGWLNKRNIAIAGILAEGLWKDDERQGFDLVDLRTGSRTPLARRLTDPNHDAVTPFNFFPQGMIAGAKALDPERCRGSMVILVDEVGRLEMKGEGWARFLDPLLLLEPAVHIWVVRESLVADVCRRWNLKSVKIIHVNDGNCLETLKALCLI